MIADLARWLSEELNDKADAASLDVQGRDVLIHPPSVASLSAHVANLRLRPVASDLLDLWLEVDDESVGPFEVRYPQDRVDMVGVARAMIEGRLEIRAALWGGGGTLTWPGGRWSTGSLARLASRAVDAQPYPFV